MEAKKDKGSKKGEDYQEIYVKAIHPHPPMHASYSHGFDHYGYDHGYDDIIIDDHHGGYGDLHYDHVPEYGYDHSPSYHRRVDTAPLDEPIIEGEKSIVGYPSADPAPIHPRTLKRSRRDVPDEETHEAQEHNSDLHVQESSNSVRRSYDTHHGKKDFFKPAPYHGPKLGVHELLPKAASHLTNHGKIGNDPIKESHKLNHHAYDKPIAHFGGFGGGGDRYGPGIKGYSYLVDHIEGPHPVYHDKSHAFHHGHDHKRVDLHDPYSPGSNHHIDISHKGLPLHGHQDIHHEVHHSHDSYKNDHHSGFHVDHHAEGHNVGHHDGPHIGYASGGHIKRTDHRAHLEYDPKIHIVNPRLHDQRHFESRKHLHNTQVPSSFRRNLQKLHKKTHRSKTNGASLYDVHHHSGHPETPHSKLGRNSSKDLVKNYSAPVYIPKSARKGLNSLKSY